MSLSPESPKPATATRKKLLKDILRLVFVTLFFGAVAYLIHLPGVREQLFDVEAWRARSRGYGPYSWLVLTGILSVANALGAPRVWISALAGALYGAVEGTVLGQLSTLLGATANFYTGRWFLRGPFKRRLPKRLKIWYDRFGENGFWWVFYIRLFPLGNATLVNLTSGAARVKYRHFLPATFLGYLPFTLAFALFGSAAAKQKWQQGALAMLLFLAVVLGRWLYRRKHPVQDVVEEN